jgi:hypothetical protein
MGLVLPELPAVMIPLAQVRRQMAASSGLARRLPGGAAEPPRGFGPRTWSS